MLIDTGITIAYKCLSCGTFEFFDVSLFGLSCKKGCSYTCRCNKSSILVYEDNARDYKIKIPCIACGKNHIYSLSRKEILLKDIHVFHCPETGMQQCFIGSDSEVRSKIDNLEKEFDELMDRFGYDSYFKNTQVMLDALNKIHDIAEQGNLACECGNNDIELMLSTDRILLKCRKCPGNAILQAASNEDLKDILMKRQILLLQDFPAFRPDSERSYMRKTDGK